MSESSLINILEDYMFNTGKELRSEIAAGNFNKPTSGIAPGYIQANLVVLPYSWAYDFLLFAQRNPKPCPVLEVGEKGSFSTKFLAQNSDIRTDIPKYNVYRDGILTEELSDISSLWKDDYVFFLLGCSFTFEQALLKADIDVRHITENVNVPMYNTSIMCKSAEKFKESPVVVSMRPFSPADAIKAVEITRDYPAVHGSPIHLGDPSLIGIDDLSKPDYGDAVTINKGEIPVFWGCGVTPQKAAMIAKPPIMITHAPGYMFVGDKKDSEFKL